MLWQLIIAGTKERFEGHKHPQPPPKEYIHKLRGLLPIPLTCWRGARGLMWGARGPFPPAAAIVVAVVTVTPVVFCAAAIEKRNRNTKTSWWLPKSLFITIFCKTYCNSYIANSSVARAQVVAWLGPNHYGPMDPGILGIAGKLLSLQE
jgi:hypothetical protein